MHKPSPSARWQVPYDDINFRRPVRTLSSAVRRPFGRRLRPDETTHAAAAPTVAEAATQDTDRIVQNGGGNTNAVVDGEATPNVIEAGTQDANQRPEGTEGSANAVTVDDNDDPDRRGPVQKESIVGRYYPELYGLGGQYEEYDEDDEDDEDGDLQTEDHVRPGAGRGIRPLYDGRGGNPFVSAATRRRRRSDYRAGKRRRPLEADDRFPPPAGYHPSLEAKDGESPLQVKGEKPATPVRAERVQTHANLKTGHPDVPGTSAAPPTRRRRQRRFHNIWPFDKEEAMTEEIIHQTEEVHFTPAQEAKLTPEQKQLRMSRSRLLLLFDLDLSCVMTTEGLAFLGPELIGGKKQMRTIFWDSWIRCVLLIVPVALAVGCTQGESIPTFVVNFIATIPLANVAGFAGDELSLRTGISTGSLISVTMSNIAQIVSSGLLLRSRQVEVLRTSLIGGILCTILLILGLSFVVGAFDKAYQEYNLLLAHTSANMLSLASTSLLVPTVSRLLKQSSDENITRQSRGAAVILIVVYFAYVFFQLHTHRKFLEQPDEPSSESEQWIEVERTVGASFNIGGLISVAQGNTKRHKLNPEDIDADRMPSLSIPVAALTLSISTVLLYFVGNYAVNSIDVLSERGGVPETFIGLVLLPLLNNFDAGPIESARQNRVSVTIRITVGKCLQTALLVTPLMIIAGWGLGIEAMTLYFDGFEVASLFSSIVLLNYLIIDGTSTWIQGVLLMGDWGMIALAAFYAEQ